MSGWANYVVSMLTFAGLYALMALGLNVIWGMAGMINLGLVGFFATGAYVSALTTKRLGWPRQPSSRASSWNKAISTRQSSFFSKWRPRMSASATAQASRSVPVPSGRGVRR